MSVTVKLPVGDEPDWEIKDADENETYLKSTAESFAALQSLRQSRNTWLTGIFPKFSTKAKGKLQPEVVPPPHSSRLLGKCEVEIGPHTFYDTSFFEISYLPEVPQQQQLLQGSASSNPAAPQPSVDLVSPALLAQVNVAAASDPALHQLLQVAAAGQANQEQLTTLGLLITTLASRIAQTQAPQNPSTDSIQSVPVPQAPLREPDLVLEFKENQSERLLIPRDIAACEMNASPEGRNNEQDISLYTFVPFGGPEQPQAGEEISPTLVKSPAVIRISKAPKTLWTSLRAWMYEGAFEPTARVTFLEKARSWHRTFPQFRLPPGQLLSQLQQHSTNRYTMRPLKPPANDSLKPKRIRPRKSAPKPPSPPPPLLPPDEQEIITKPKPLQRRRKSAPKPPPDIACIICGTKGVPLLRGGRVCRSCLPLADDATPAPSTSSFRSGIFITTVAPSFNTDHTSTLVPPLPQVNEAVPSSEVVHPSSSV